MAGSRGIPIYSVRGSGASLVWGDLKQMTRGFLTADLFSEANPLSFDAVLEVQRGW
jgi:hypothetical protein